MILVAGGTGQLGRRVVRLLTDRGERVRVLTRDPDRAHQFSAGIQTVVGDVRRGSLAEAVRGCDAIVSSIHGFTGPGRPSPAAVDGAGNSRLIAAAVEAGADRFVLVSVIGAAPDHPMSLHRMKYAAEQLLWASPLNGVVVRAAPFLETWLQVIGGKIAAGGPALVLGPGRNPINFVSADDVAAFVGLALSGDPRVGAAISVAGPEQLTFTEIAKRLVATRERARIKHVPLPVLRAMSLLARPVNPAFARRARAAVVMNTVDMTFEGLPTRARFADVPSTTMAQVMEGRSASHSG